MIYIKLLFLIIVMSFVRNSIIKKKEPSWPAEPEYSQVLKCKLYGTVCIILKL